MDGNTIPVQETTTIIVKASGDLFLRGAERGEVHFQSEDRIRVNQSKDTLYVETHANLDLEVPLHSTVIVEKVGGSALLQDFDGSLTVQKIGGDFAMRRISRVRVEKVGGSCLVDGVSERLMIGRVGGNLTLRQVIGSVAVDSVGGDGDFQIISAAGMEARTGGDLRVYFAETLDGKITLRAGGNVEIFLPGNCQADVFANSNGEHIRCDLKRQNAVIDEQIQEHRYHVTLGEGSAKLEASAGGDILVSDEAVEPKPIFMDIDRREEAWTKARERYGSPTWSAGFGFDRASAWADMVSRRAQEAARRGEQQAQAAMRRTEDQIRQAAEREMRRAGGYPPPHQTLMPAQPVTDEERMLVLTMLQENKITVEQAEKLLAALEGNTK